MFMELLCLLEAPSGLVPSFVMMDKQVQLVDTWRFEPVQPLIWNFQKDAEPLHGFPATPKSPRSNLRPDLNQGDWMSALAF